ncbi:MAG: tetratricopeptide repeat protein [Acidobacteria bacterium]|nr:tetratricopeptide repeat protein [Acidobacteriota bacterium]
MAQTVRPKGLGDSTSPTSSSATTKRRPPKKTPSIRTPTGVVVFLGRSPRYYLDLGKQSLQKGDFVAAKIFFEEGLKRTVSQRNGVDLADELRRGQHKAECFAEGSAAIEQNQLNQALTAYQQVLKADPTDEFAKQQAIKVLLRQIEVAQKQSNWAEMMGYIEQARQLDPVSVSDEVLVQALLGQALEAVGRDEGAAQALFQRVLTIDPTNQVAQRGQTQIEGKQLLRLATAALNQNQYAEAEASFAKVLALDPNNEEAYRGKNQATAHLTRLRAEVAYQERDFGQAQQLFRDAARILTEDESILDRLAELQIRLSSKPPALGTIQLKIPAQTTSRIQLRGNQAFIRSDSGRTEALTSAQLSAPLPYQAFTIRLNSISKNGRARIQTFPSLANQFLTELVVEPKSPGSGDIQIECSWKLVAKSKAQWQGQIGPGTYQLLWQGPFVDIKTISGVQPNQKPVIRESLPLQMADMKVKSISGTAKVRLGSPGTSLNYFTSTIVLEALQPTTVELEVEWKIR